MRTALDVHGKLHIRLQHRPEENNTWVGYIEDPRRGQDDDIGALYYVVAVIFIYGLSIVMMIASHIRRNKQDNQLRTYLKEMATLRKSDRREKVLSKMTDLANRQQQQEALEAKNKLEKERLRLLQKENENETDDQEVNQALLGKENNEDNTDSVFLPPEFCISPAANSRKPEVRWDRSSESSSYRNTSVSSKGSGRNTSSCSTVVSNLPSSDTRSPSLSERRHSCSHYSQPRVRSPSMHDYRSWKTCMTQKSSNLQDYRSSRLHERPSPNNSEHRSILTGAQDGLTSSLTEFRLSPRCARARASTMHEPRPPIIKPGAKSKGGGLALHNETKPQKNLLIQQQPVKASSDVKISFPASFHVVDEDAAL
ncbi:uncharacterized protein LOC101863595 [Aplysia californica]|uniref:Uncharacterized protein LOC101863595 n=1 Tax=Aplysia californica TaxID=6500 RepID=A0ABM0JVZ3_APLCA|nr:uncharacterized protein LOC101863595 [Aplysia californica]